MTKLAVWIAALGVSALGASVANAQSMSLTSSEIKEGGTIANEQVFKGFGCNRRQRLAVPELERRAEPVPRASPSASLIRMRRPAAAAGTGWYSIFRRATTSLPKGAGDVKKKLMPKGAIQSRTDFGTDGYGGPCPPAGDKPHRYQITVFAVDVDKLPFAKNDARPAALVGFDLHFHTLAKATLTGLYGR